MHEHEHDDPEVLSEIEKLGYDPRDVPVEKTWVHAAMLFLSCFVVGLLAWGVMAAIDRYEGSKSTGRQEVSERKNMPQDPYPLLQTNSSAKTDIVKLRTEEALKTEMAGWVDKEKGVARIPVSHAIELILKEGMPATATGAAPASVTGEDPAQPGTAVTPGAFRSGGEAQQ